MFNITFYKSFFLLFLLGFVLLHSFICFESRLTAMSSVAAKPVHKLEENCADQQSKNEVGPWKVAAVVDVLVEICQVVPPVKTSHVVFRAVVLI